VRRIEVPIIRARARIRNRRRLLGRLAQAYGSARHSKETGGARIVCAPKLTRDCTCLSTTTRGRPHHERPRLGSKQQKSAIEIASSAKPDERDDVFDGGAFGLVRNTRLRSGRASMARWRDTNALSWPFDTSAASIEFTPALATARPPRLCRAESEYRGDVDDRSPRLTASRSRRPLRPIQHRIKIVNR